MVQAYLIAFIVPLTVIIGWGLLNCSILRLTFVSSVVMGILESAIIVYISGFLDLRIGIVIITFMALAGYGSLVRNNNLRKCIYEAMLVVCLYTFLFVLNAGKTLYKWDDYSHWGQMLKECLRLNTYYYVDESVLKYHKEYPPFGTIVEYIFCVFSGKYKEAFAFNAKTILGDILILDAFQRVSNNKGINDVKEWLVSLYGLPLVILLPIITSWSDGLYYRTIYAEGFMVTLMVYAIMCVLYPHAEPRINIFVLTLVLSSLAITKQIGPLFVVFVFLLMIIRYKLLGETIHLYVLIPYIISAIAWCIWKLATAGVADKGQFSGNKFSLSAIVSILVGRGEEFQYQCTRNYIKELYKTSLTSFAPITFIVIIASIIIAIIGMYIFKMVRTRMGTLLIWSILIFPVYAIVLQVMYWFGFSVGESVGVACYDRYMNSLVAPVLIAVVMLLFSIMSKGKRGALLNIVLFVGIIIFLNGRALYTELKQGLYTTSDAHWFENDADIIINNTEVNSSVYLISPADNQSICNIIGYLANPRDISNIYYAPKVNERAEVEEYMLQYDYVYIASVDNKFIDVYGYMFPSELTNQQLYQVNKDGSLNRVY